MTRSSVHRRKAITSVGIDASEVRMGFASSSVPLRDAPYHSVDGDIADYVATVGSVLAEICSDMEKNPDKVSPIGEAVIARAQELTRHVSVADDDSIPDHITI